MLKEQNIIIIGGGLAGLTSAILLKRKGFDVTLIERKHYPFHRVCGEYISNEVLPFLCSLGLDVNDYGAAAIRRLAVSSVSGNIFHSALDLGGFGISRYTLDELFYKKALSIGVNFILGEKVTNLLFRENIFEITLSDDRKLYSPLVIAAYGKRSNLDQKLNRSFFYLRSPYVGVKYHIKTDFPEDLIQLDNFEGGYCGISKIEDERYCLCYLSENRNLKLHGSLHELEKQVLYKNTRLKRHFTDSDFLFEKPEVINEISFSSKTIIDNHLLFCGDAAGMITPLCGNGMAIAIHSAKILTDILAAHAEFRLAEKRLLIEREWQKQWQKQFAFRLQTGRFIQHLFGHPSLNNMAVTALNALPGTGRFLIKKTHGESFNL